MFFSVLENLEPLCRSCFKGKLVEYSTQTAESGASIEWRSQGYIIGSPQSKHSRKKYTFSKYIGTSKSLALQLLVSSSFWQLR